MVWEHFPCSLESLRLVQGGEGDVPVSLSWHPSPQSSAGLWGQQRTGDSTQGRGLTLRDERREPELAAGWEIWSHNAKNAIKTPKRRLADGSSAELTNGAEALLNLKGKANPPGLAVPPGVPGKAGQGRWMASRARGAIATAATGCHCHTGSGRIPPPPRLF